MTALYVVALAVALAVAFIIAVVGGGLTLSALLDLVSWQNRERLDRALFGWVDWTLARTQPVWSAVDVAGDRFGEWVERTARRIDERLGL